MLSLEIREELACGMLALMREEEEHAALPDRAAKRREPELGGLAEAAVAGPAAAAE